MRQENDNSCRQRPHLRGYVPGVVPCPSGLLRRFLALSAALMLFAADSATHVLSQPRIRYPGLTFTLLEDSVGAQVAETASQQPDSVGPDANLLERDRRSLQEIYGPFAEEHLGTLTSLGEALQNEGNHEDAIPQLNEALQIARIQFGLNSAEQLPIIESLVRSHIAMKDYSAVDDMVTLDLHIVRQAYPEGSDTYERAMAENALWNMDYFQYNYLYLHQPGSLETSSAVRFSDNSIDTQGIFGNPASAFNTGIPPAVIQSSRYISRESSRLNSAEDLFSSLLDSPESSEASRLEAIEQLLTVLWLRTQELYLYRRYLELDRDAIITYRDAYMMETGHYRDGLKLLEQKMDLLQDSENSTPEAIAGVMLDLADWHLAYSRDREGREIYREVWDYLTSEDAGYTPDDANSHMNPSIALMLPQFVTHQFEITWVEAEEDITGYIDVGFDLPDDGQIRGSSIEDYSEGTPIPLRHILRNYMRNATFRPKLVDGEAVQQRDLTVRYQYHY